MQFGSMALDISLIISEMGDCAVGPSFWFILCNKNSNLHAQKHQFKACLLEGTFTGYLVLSATNTSVPLFIVQLLSGFAEQS